MKQATKKQLLNAQKVDGAIISEENGTIAFRKAPWNDTEVICEQPKVIPGRMVCSGEKGGDEFDFKPYERTGEKLFEEIFKTKHAVVRTTKRTVQVNYTFSRDLDKQDRIVAMLPSSLLSVASIFLSETKAEMSTLRQMPTVAATP